MQTLMVTHQLAGIVENLIARCTVAEGLSVVDAMTMAWVADRPGIACSDIAWYLARDRSNVQQTLRRLERRGFVSRDQEPGRPRAVGWFLTERGDATWEIVRNRLRLEELELERQIPNLRDVVPELMRIADGLSRARGKKSGLGLYDRPAPGEAMPLYESEEAAFEDAEMAAE